MDTFRSRWKIRKLPVLDSIFVIPPLKIAVTSSRQSGYSQFENLVRLLFLPVSLECRDQRGCKGLEDSTTLQSNIQRLSFRGEYRLSNLGGIGWRLKKRTKKNKTGFPKSFCRSAIQPFNLSVLTQASMPNHNRTNSFACTTLVCLLFCVNSG